MAWHLSPCVIVWRLCFGMGTPPGIAFKQLDCFHQFVDLKTFNRLKTSGLPVGVEFKGVSCIAELVLPVEQLTSDMKNGTPEGTPFLLLWG
jgi:hypothetical protein